LKREKKSKDAKDALKAYRTRGIHFGEEFTIVVTHNPKTQRKQKRKYEEKRKKTLKELAELKKKVETRKRRGRKWTQKGAITAMVDTIPKDMRAVFEYDVKKKRGRGGGLIVEYGIDDEMERLRYLSFGKIIHFTDMHDWSDEEISSSYDAKYGIEDDFKWLKDKLLVPIKPVHVRTDQHIRGHVFVCVMGLLFYRYIQWKLRSTRRKWSTPKLAATLDGIRLALVLRDKHKKKGRFVVERMNKEEASLFSELSMAEYVKA
jgi:transposase